MVTSFKISNFKSFIQAELPLSRVTLLVGANASGKSNALEGIRLLSWLAEGNRLYKLQDLVNVDDKIIRGHIKTLMRNEAKSFSLGCTTSYNKRNINFTIEIERRGAKDELHIKNESGEFLSDFFVYRTKSPTQGEGRDISVEYNNFSRGGKKPLVTCVDDKVVFNQLLFSTQFKKNKETRSDKAIIEIASQLDKYLNKILFLDPVPHQMRDYSYKTEDSLHGNGKNLSSVIYRLIKERNQKEELIAFIKSLPEQNIEDINFIETPRDEVMLTLIESFGGTLSTRDAGLLSDGTLRVLAIAAALLSAEEQSLVVIEEVDNGVHPSRTAALLKHIQAIAEKRNIQVLLTTHNPTLLDAVEIKNASQVIFCYRDPLDGSSKLIPLDEIKDYPELLSMDSLGSLLTKGLIEKYVKEPVSQEEKEAQLAAFLEGINSDE